MGGMTPDTAYQDGQVAADLMLRDPKALPADASVADVRAVLANDHVQMVLLTEGRAFRGAITALPDGAPPEAPALGYVDPSPPTIAPEEPGGRSVRPSQREPEPPRARPRRGREPARSPLPERDPHEVLQEPGGRRVHRIT